MTTSSAVIDKAISDIRLFLFRDLAQSLSGQDGVFEPRVQWVSLLQHASAIMSADHILSAEERLILRDALDTLQDDLNHVVSILRESAEAGHGGTTANDVIVSRLDAAMARARTRFDEAIRSFYELQSSLKENEVSKMQVPATHYHSHFGEVHMGDVFQGISNSTIVSRSKVEGAFNRLQDSGQGESAKLLVEIGKRVSDANNSAAGAVYSQMAEELSKPAHDKNVLKSCWHGLVAISSAARQLVC